LDKKDLASRGTKAGWRAGLKRNRLRLGVVGSASPKSSPTDPDLARRGGHNASNHFSSNSDHNQADDAIFDWEGRLWIESYPRL
jgi:hypothetical protein